MVKDIKDEAMRPICCKTKVFKNIYLRNFITTKIVGKCLKSGSQQYDFYI